MNLYMYMHDKKKISILIGIFIGGVFALVIGFTVVVVIIGNKKKEISFEEFQTILESKGYDSAEIEIVGDVKKAKIVIEDDIKIEFVEASEEDAAKVIYLNIFYKLKSGPEITYRKIFNFGKHYSKLEAEGDEVYRMVVRVRNTLIKIEGTQEYKKTIKEFIKEIGY